MIIAKPKCPYCSNEIDRKTDDYEKHSNGRLFHKECYEKFLKVNIPECPKCKKKVYVERQPHHIHTNKKVYHENCFKLFEYEKESRNSCLDYLFELFETKKLHSTVHKQLETYVSEGYTFRGIELTLRYFYEIQENPLEEKHRKNIGIVPYIYDEAKDYYAELNHIGEEATKKKVDATEEVIYLDLTKKRKRRKFIDIGAIK